MFNKHCLSNKTCIWCWSGVAWPSWPGAVKSLIQAEIGVALCLSESHLCIAPPLNIAPLPALLGSNPPPALLCSLPTLRRGWALTLLPPPAPPPPHLQQSQLPQVCQKELIHLVVVIEIQISGGGSCAVGGGDYVKGNTIVSSVKIWNRHSGSSVKHATAGPWNDWFCMPQITFSKQKNYYPVPSESPLGLEKDFFQSPSLVLLINFCSNDLQNIVFLRYLWNNRHKNINDMKNWW